MKVVKTNENGEVMSVEEVKQRVICAGCAEIDVMDLFSKLSR